MSCEVQSGFLSLFSPSVVLVLWCSLPMVKPSAPYRRACTFFRWQRLRMSRPRQTFPFHLTSNFDILTLDHMNHSSGSARLPRCSPRDRLQMSFPSLFRCWRSVFIEELDEDQSLQVRCPALAKRTRCESGKIALSSTRCEAIGDMRPSMAKNCWTSSSSSAGRLRQEPSITKNCWTSSSSSAGRLRQEPSITKNCWTSSSKWKPRAQVARELPPSPQGRLRHQRPRSAGYDCVINATVREGRV